jgi:hypothetical protein
MDLGKLRVGEWNKPNYVRGYKRVGRSNERVQPNGTKLLFTNLWSKKSHNLVKIAILA